MFGAHVLLEIVVADKEVDAGGDEARDVAAGIVGVGEA